VDESPSDFVAGHVYDWFEPERPNIPIQPPLPPARDGHIRRAVSEWEVPHRGIRARLTEDQHRAVMDGLSTRVQLLKGPPGTGKTVTTATSILAKTAANLSVGSIILMAANTNLAVDTLLRRLALFAGSFRQEAIRQGIDMSNVTVACVHSSDAPHDQDGICHFNAVPCVTRVKGWLRNSVLLVGGTTNAILKMANELSRRNPFIRQPGGFQADVLVIDEASMMLFPHFLSLASIVRPRGQILLAGDGQSQSRLFSWKLWGDTPIGLSR
jgi:hypothetical protein